MLAAAMCSVKRPGHYEELYQKSTPQKERHSTATTDRDCELAIAFPDSQCRDSFTKTDAKKD